MANEKKITVSVVSLNGDEKHTCSFDEAFELISDEMNKGKWLYVTDDETGETAVHTELHEFSDNHRQAREDLLNAKSIRLMASMRGGEAPSVDGPSIVIGGKIYPMSEIRMKTDRAGNIISIGLPADDLPGQIEGDIAETLHRLTEIITDAEEPPEMVTTHIELYKSPDAAEVLSVYRKEDDPRTFIAVNQAKGMAGLADAVIHMLRFIDSKWVEMAQGDMRIVRDDRQ